MEMNIVTTIDGSGVVEAKNDRAHFTLTFRAKGESLPEAQQQVKDKTTLALKELEKKKMKLDGELSVTPANYKLEHREGNEKYPAGFQSVNTITWTLVVDGSNVDEVYAVCAKLDANTPAPYFSISNREVMFEQAIQKATEDVKEKLDKECKLLGVDSKNLKILNWHYGYEGYLPANDRVSSAYGARGATGPQGSLGSPGVYGAVGPFQNPVMKLGSIYQELLDAKIESGTVSVRLAVRVNYVWKE